MSKKIRFSGLFLCFAVVLAVSPVLQAQNIRVGTEDYGSAYTIGSGSTNQTMTFTEAGATATATGTQTWSGRIVLAAAGSISVATPTTTGSTAKLTVDGGIYGSGDLTKTGSGTFLLNSASKQTGWTIINGGIFQSGKSHVFSVDSVFSLKSGTLDLNDTVQEIAALTGTGTLTFGNAGTGSLTVGGHSTDSTFSGNFEGDGTFVKVGSGTTILTGSSQNAATIDFDVAAGNLSVDGDFSNASSTATVRNGGTLGGSGTFYDVNVESGGTLAPGTRTSYAVLATDTLTVANDLTLDSDSSLNIRVDETGNSDRVIVGGIFSNTNQEAKLEIHALAGQYSGQETYDTFLVDAAGTNIADFVAANISIDQKFLQLENVAGGNNSFRISRIENYFADRAQGRNQREVAAVFDRTGAAGLWRPMTNIANSTNQADIDAAYLDISGAVKANSLMLGQWRTSRYAMNHLDLTPCGMSHDGAFWVEAVHQTTDVDADVNSRAYGVSRTGFMLGGEERAGGVVIGMLGGYSQPFLYSDGDKYTVDDAQFGFYGGTKFFGFLETKVHLGYGHQEYESRRFLRSSALFGNSSSERIDGKFSGDSMSMAIEFAVPFDWEIVRIRPLLALDSDLTWQHPYTETGDSGCELLFDRTFYDRTFIRLGVTGQLGSVAECTPLTFVGRLNYSSQVGGESTPLTPSRFVADPSQRMKIAGADPGKNYINCGIGFRYGFDSCRFFYGDYDYNGSNRSREHLASLGYVQKW